jgi:hypothetical protein
MNSGQALRMTSLFAMVSSHREPDERRTITLTPTLSPQGRGRLRKGFARGSARNDQLDGTDGTDGIDGIDGTDGIDQTDETNEINEQTKRTNERSEAHGPEDHPDR